MTSFGMRAANTLQLSIGGVGLTCSPRLYVYNQGARICLAIVASCMFEVPS
jgi:hypothetical protein